MIMTSMGEPKWYVLKVVGGQENKVKYYIETECVKQNLQDCITQILIPAEKVYEMRAGKRKAKERNFFPGYVLMCADLSDGRVHHIIKNIPNALGFLSTRGWGTSKAPVPLRQAEVNRILGNVNEEIEADDLGLASSFTVGETVKVIDGPFSGFSGNIREIFEERKKLNITVKIFERDTPVELSYAQVEKII
jgi:transcriptional antiterminator NusG